VPFACFGFAAGAALVRRLARENVELLTVKRSEVDLCDQAAVFNWFAKARPQAVFLAAAKVGGIVANNTLRGEFIYDLSQPVWLRLHQCDADPISTGRATIITPNTATSSRP
jgi:hypothetical protein